jgi:hypothetical protein
MVVDTVTYAKDLRNVIDDRWYTTCATILGEELNERADLPDKGTLLEKTVRDASGRRFEWVDQIGYDLVDSKFGYKVELKFASYSLITERGMPRDNVTVRIKNNRGSNKGTVIENPADYYIIGQENAMAVISGKDIQKHLIAKGDGIDARIPYSELISIFKYSEPYEIKIKPYKEKKNELQDDHLIEMRTKMLEVINATKQG